MIEKRFRGGFSVAPALVVYAVAFGHPSAQIPPQSVTAPIAVSVSTPAGEPVRDLTMSDFSVLVENQPVEIRTFSANPALAVRLIVVDDSVARYHLDGARTIAAALIQSLAPTTVASVLTSQGTITLTNDRVRLSDFVDRVLRPQPGDVLTRWSWDTMKRSHRDFVARREQLASSKLAPEVMASIVLTAGMDFVDSEAPAIRPEVEPSDAAKEIVRAGIVTFGVGFDLTNYDKLLEWLCKESGGRYFPAKRADLRAETLRIMRDLQSRYLVGIAAVPAAGVDRAIEVRVTRPGLIVRARSF